MRRLARKWRVVARFAARRSAASRCASLESARRCVRSFMRSAILDAREILLARGAFDLARRGLERDLLEEDLLFDLTARLRAVFFFGFGARLAARARDLARLLVRVATRC